MHAVHWHPIFLRAGHVSVVSVRDLPGRGSGRGNHSCFPNPPRAGARQGVPTQEQTKISARFQPSRSCIINPRFLSHDVEPIAQNKQALAWDRVRWNVHCVRQGGRCASEACRRRCRQNLVSSMHVTGPGLARHGSLRASSLWVLQWASGPSVDPRPVEDSENTKLCFPPPT